MKYTKYRNPKEIICLSIILFTFTITVISSLYNSEGTLRIISKKECALLFEEKYFQRKDLELLEKKQSKIPEISIKDQIYVLTSNTRYPFKILTKEREFPRADGDEAQRHILEIIELEEKCRNNPNTTVIDIGGYYGDFGIHVASFGCKVYIFEPTPFQYWLIKSSVALNGFSDRIKVFNFAVSSGSSNHTFREFNGKTEEVPLDTKGTNVFQIESVSLDSLFKNDDVFLLKIDVEGFEPTVIFEGCREMLSRKKIKHIITEYTPWWTENGKGPWDHFIERLHSYGDKNVGIYALDREEPMIFYLKNTMFEEFYRHHKRRRFQTDIYIDMTGQLPKNKSLLWDSNTFS
jgi:FkbM family methyltransferase